MANFPWLGSNEFDLTLMTKNTRSGDVNVFVLVEPDSGIRPEIASIIGGPAYGFKTNGNGYWLTTNFIKKKADGNTELELSKLGNALKTDGVNVYRIQSSKAKLTSILEQAQKRGLSFGGNSRIIEFKKTQSTLVALNADDEEVYQNATGERAIVNNGVYSLLDSNASIEQKKRFLIAGAIESDAITIDQDFLVEFILSQIQRKGKTARWSEEDTIGAITSLVQQDASNASNLIEVINIAHLAVNKGIYSRSISEISEGAIAENGLLRSLRVSTSIYSKLLPIFDEEGNKVGIYKNPFIQFAEDALGKVSKVISQPEFDSEFISKEIDLLSDGDSLVISFPSESLSVQQVERDLIDSARKQGDIVVGFDFMDASTPGQSNSHRFYKFVKSTALAESTSKYEIPSNLLSSSQFSELVNLVNFVKNANTAQPFSRSELEDAVQNATVEALKEIKYEPMTAHGTKPVEYVVPAALFKSQRDAMGAFIEKHGDPADYLAEKLQFSMEKINQVYSSAQIEHIALSISRYEDGLGMINGDGAGSGKTRMLASIMRYQALVGDQIFFVTPDKSLLNNLWREIELLDASSLIIPYVASKEPIVDEFGEPIVFSNGQTSEDHYSDLKRRIREKDVIPGQYNAVFTTYSTINSKPVFKTIDQISNFKAGFDDSATVIVGRVKEKGARIYDNPLCFKKFCDRMDTILLADESHNATGKSNTRKAIDLIKSACSGKVFASATAMKNADKIEIYADAMRVNLSIDKLTETLKLGGEAALEAFASSLTQEGGYVRVEMPTRNIKTRLHVDETSSVDYELINDAFADVMGDYIKLSAYISKARLINNERVKEAIQGKEYKPNSSIGEEIGINTSGFGSRFTKTTELFVACLKSKMVADEAIKTLQSGNKALIPLECTSETNLNWIVSEYNLPKFTPDSIAKGELDAWISTETAKNPNFKGVPDNFDSALKRMFNESSIVTIKKIDDKNKVETIEVKADDLVADLLKEEDVEQYLALKEAMSLKLTTFPLMPLSPYDAILNEVKKRGYRTAEYSGRKLKVMETPSGIKYLMTQQPRDLRLSRQRFQDGDLDCVVMGRSGWTGVEWHAIESDPRPVDLIQVVPPMSPDLDQQLAGRVNRTGQVASPTITYTSSGQVLEQRLQNQALHRLRSMNATSKGDANMDVIDGQVNLFSQVGIEACKRYLYANPELLEKLGLEEGDIEKTYSGGGSIATAATQRIQMLKSREAQQIMNGIDSEYFNYMNELEENGINPFGASLLDVEAVVSKTLKVGGVDGTDNPWLQPVYVASLRYSEARTLLTSSGVEKKIKVNDAPQSDRVDSSDILTKINALKSSDRFSEFSKHLLKESASALSALQKLTHDIDKVNKGSGRKWVLKEKYLMAEKMANLLQGMQLGQVVTLDRENGPVEGVVTDIYRLKLNGYAPTLEIDVPGEGTIIASPYTVENLSINKTPIIYSNGSKIANAFDSERQWSARTRVAFIGSAFPTIMAAADILKAKGHTSSKSCKVTNITIQSPDKGKHVEKVVLLPEDVSFLDVICSPVPLSATEATHFIKFAGKHVKRHSTAASDSAKKDSTLSLVLNGDPADPNCTVTITSKKSAAKELMSDTAFDSISESDANGDCGFTSTRGSKYASLSCKIGNLYSVLDRLEKEHGHTFFSSNFGLRFLEDFNNARLPTDYKAWRSQCDKEAYENVYVSNANPGDESEIELDEILKKDDATAKPVAANAIK